ncbi:cleavage factor two protein 2 [Diutina catenulata]
MFSFSLLSPTSSDLSFKAGVLCFDNELRILCDPSWNGRDVHAAAFMEHHLQTITCIVLSHPTPEFVSGYVLLCIQFPAAMAQIPVYSTLPVNQLGRIATVEFYRSGGVLGPLETSVVELDEVDEWWDRVVPLKYMQSTTVADGTLTITPFNAGHSLGGTFWLAARRLDKVIYAPKWNHSKDSFLNSAHFLSASGNPMSQLVRPSAIITSTDLGSTMPHKKRTHKFLELVDAVLANGGSCVLPCSISGRFLELFHLIDAHLSGAPVPVYFLSYSGTKVLSYASNLLDWMAPNLLKQWQDVAADNGEHPGSGARGPFDPSKVDLMASPDELARFSGPKIVFCSGLDFSDGDMSTEAFKQLATDEKTTIILTEKSGGDAMARTLYRSWRELAEKAGSATDGAVVPFEKVVSTGEWSTEEPLKGSALTKYQSKVHAHRKERLAAKVRDRKNKNLLEADPDEDSSEDEAESSEDEATQAAAHPEQPADASVATELASHEAFVTDHIKQALDNNKPLDLTITYKLKPRQAMFPFVLPKVKTDDYGEVIDVRRFQLVEDNSANQIIMEGKKRFEEERRGKRGRRDRGSDRRRLNPQEQLNNQLLKKYLDALHEPKRRVAGSTVSQSSRQLRIRCGLAFIDLAGTVDVRSLAVIVNALKPANLVLLPDWTSPDAGGAKELEQAFATTEAPAEVKQEDATGSRWLSLAAIRANNSLASAMATHGRGMAVHSVAPGETVAIGEYEDGGIGPGNFAVQLDDELVADLHWQTIDGSYRVAPVTAQLEVRNPKRSASHALSAHTEFTLKRAKPGADAVAPVSDDTPVGAPRLAIGNIRLPELKKKLMKRNLNAVFKSEGTLVVNDAVAVRKVSYSGADSDDSGDIVIDGLMGALYYEVKDCIREMLAYI